MKQLVLIVSLTYSLLALAVPEADFTRRWKDSIWPFFMGGESLEFINAQGMKIKTYAFVHPNAKAAVAIFPGRAEAALTYAETVYDFYQQEISVFLIDHQGQGESSRLLADPSKGHVQYFNDYIVDTRQWVTEIINPRLKNVPFYLVAESMGGTIAALYAHQYPDNIQGLLLATPMFQINTGKSSERSARLLARTLYYARQGLKYAPGKGPYVHREPSQTNIYTQSEVRYNKENELNDTFPDIQLGGPTVTWALRALNTTLKFDYIGAEINIPTLVFQAELDEVVSPWRQNTYCSESSACQLILLKGSKHQVFFEKDEYRDQMLNRMFTFMRGSRQ